jgi:hypothetical protein
MGKTRKNTKTDKIKHSVNAYRAKSPKRGAGGKGTWGSTQDDMNNYDMDEIRKQTTYIPEEEEEIEEKEETETQV